MVKLRNEDKTYNVYDFTNGDGKWLVVDNEWLSGVNMKGVVELEIHWGSCSSKELKVIYYNGSCIWYKNISGSWGFPYKVV